MIKQKATAGTLESSDIFVEIAPAEAGTGISLDLTSVVYQQFGPEIEAVIYDTLKELGVADAALTVKDRGAVDCTIRARIETAVCRGKGEE
ncbi:MAG: citrate lyase acyl carrier protein [Firmicutes bacterium]|nr:citrate lyase acyl carrier protein [Bacillota bacterium]